MYALYPVGELDAPLPSYTKQSTNSSSGIVLGQVAIAAPLAVNANTNKPTPACLILFMTLFPSLWLCTSGKARCTSKVYALNPYPGSRK